MASASKTPEHVLYLQGDFDASAFRRVLALLHRATVEEPIVLHFRDVKSCEPFALGALFEVLGRCEGAVRARGLSQQHDVLLGYLGLKQS